MFWESLDGAEKESRVSVLMTKRAAVMFPGKGQTVSGEEVSCIARKCRERWQGLESTNEKPNRQPKKCQFEVPEKEDAISTSEDKGDTAPESVNYNGFRERLLETGW